MLLLLLLLLVLVSNYYGCRRGNKINTLLCDRCYLSNSESFTFEKLQIMQNINSSMFKVIFIFSDWILIKQIVVVSSTPFCYWGNISLKNCCLGEWVISFCLERDDKNLGASFESGGARVKMSRFDAFCRNVSPLVWKFFPHMVEYTSLRENSISILDR